MIEHTPGREQPYAVRDDRGLIVRFHATAIEAVRDHERVCGCDRVPLLVRRLAGGAR
ncbi:MAG: hypothetical protein QN190_14105 [Armatimonadota bacterium]|nr:hypothetical protein [Armatimonadota bacterium]